MGGRTQITRSKLGAALLVVLAPCFAIGAPAQEVHFSPEERLDTIDAALISGAQRTIDFASYALTVATGVFVAALIASAAQAGGLDISAQRLLSSWEDGDPGMRMLAEVIASAFASSLSD